MLFLASLIPNEETCWKMLIASKVTPNTIQIVGENTEIIAEKTMTLITDSVIRIMEYTK